MRFFFLLFFAMVSISMVDGDKNRQSCGPVAYAGPNLDLPFGQPTVVLDGTGSFAQCGRTIVGYKWTKLVGTPVTYTPSNFSSVVLVDFQSQVGNWAFELEVVDNTGAESTHNIVVTNL